jgi:hypothetical protein
MLLRRALPAAHQSLAHPFPIYEMRSKEPHAQPSLHLPQATAHSVELITTAVFNREV